MKRKELNNGVRILAEEDSRVRSVSIGVWIHTGSRYENEQQAGMAHFIEHMLFKGTSRWSALDIASFFDATGGYINAMTAKEYTSFYVKVPDIHAKKALHILADMYFDSLFDEEEMEKEKQVVLEEIDMYEDTPDDLVHELLAEAAYSPHPLSKPILGNESSIRGYSPQSLKAFMKQHYGGKNTIISIAGSQSDELFEEAAAIFAGAVPGEKQREVAETPFSSRIKVRRKETEQAHFCLGYEGTSLSNPKLYSLTMLNNILGGVMSSRLFQEIREDRGLAYTVFSHHEAFEDTGMLTIYAGTQEKHLQEVQDVTSSILQSLKKDGVTDREFQTVRDQLKGSLLLSMESTSAAMSRNARNEMFQQREISVEEMIRQIDQVRMQDIKQRADELFGQKPAVSLVSAAAELPKPWRIAEADGDSTG
ncbi:M16 family metallopeptidase [Alkalicoccus urumqiensis]|uniref:Peptidase M16 n=1 Tax=Alkalicoccus urumqiensis TaxID=1548213 RepID=A0A2P6MFZ3_ALKUR|nr:pitrilysin family protein [Alkalicoccus urumqiensis]PRO65183.1 peptidase M16 [Alkalicoccus urumqiensis]